MVVVIIDFDNYLKIDADRLTKENLELALTDVVVQCENLFSDFSNIQIRMYGGWHDRTTLTKQASTIQQLLSQIKIFPKINNTKIIRGNVELVSTLYELPSHSWQYTYKEKNGIPPVRIDFSKVEDTTCDSNRDSCPKFILHKFTKSKNKQCHVPGCNHVHKNIFKGIEQKMVDTMIACDVISVAKDEDIKGILILSEDQDHFPSYAIASVYSASDDKIVVGIKNKSKERLDFMSRFLNPFNIKITTIS